MRGLIIAVDGYSSTGKSTFARIIAEKLDLPHLDSGALYRSVTLFALERGLFTEEGHPDAPALEAALSEGVSIGYVRRADGEGYAIHLQGEEVGDRIRTLEVSEHVSPVAALPFVRRFVDALLHRSGAGGCVMDGRDIGTAVFPDADLKIFMTADPRVRARRRLLELEAKGETADFDEVYRNVLERDYIDSHREMNPLRRADDAVELDNSDMTVEQQVEWLAGLLRERFGIAL